MPKGLSSPAAAAARPVLVYVGTDTATGSRGIYRLAFDPAAGTLSPPVLAAEEPSPTWIALGAHRRQLFAAQAGGDLMAFAIGPVAGRLRRINRQTTAGPAAMLAHCELAPSGRMLVAADYAGGTITSFPVDAQGRLGAPLQTLAMRGPLGPNRDRQRQAHPHGVVFSPDGRLVLVCDLGLDRVLIHRIDPAGGTLAPGEPPFAAVPAGAGPRHGAFSADGRFLYVVNELDNSICVFSADSPPGALTLRQTISTLPPAASGINYAAEIRLHPNGRFVYACNRGTATDNLVVFTRDPQSGRLALIQAAPCGGTFPRSFTLSPDGHWLLCANQTSDNVVLFAVDPASGQLTPTGRQVPLARPMCVLFCH